MLCSVLIVQCLHRGVHTHRTLARDLVALECELVSLEQENSKQHDDCVVDIEAFKRLLRILDDPVDIKRIFGKDLVLPPGINAPSEVQKAEAQEKQLIEVFNMFAPHGSKILGSKELRSVHIFLTDAAAINKKVGRARLHVEHIHAASADEHITQNKNKQNKSHNHTPYCHPFNPKFEKRCCCALCLASLLPSFLRSAHTTQRNPASAKSCACCFPCFSWSWR